MKASCQSCFHWAAETAEPELVYLEEDMKWFSWKARATGELISVCTFMPAWRRTVSNHFCGNHKARGE